jgi:mRNA-degrading endonuclease RelE of RelBE toxin-antitoxin system
LERVNRRFQVVYHRDVVDRDIPALPKTARLRIRKAIEDRLMTEPIQYGKPLRFDLSGHRRIRVGDYRVVYSVDERKLQVFVVAIRNRKDVYDD